MIVGYKKNEIESLKENDMIWYDIKNNFKTQFGVTAKYLMGSLKNTADKIKPIYKRIH